MAGFRSETAGETATWHRATGAAKVQSRDLIELRPCISLGATVTLSVLPPGGDSTRCLPLGDAQVGSIEPRQTTSLNAGPLVGTITTAAGAAGNGVGTELGQIPMNVTYANGSLYISDWAWYNVVRRLDLSTGQETVIAGNGGKGFNGDGPATSVELGNPWGIAADAAGNVYIGDGYRVRKFDPGAGSLTTLARLDVCGFGVPGVSGLAFDNSGNLLIADGIGRILKLELSSGMVTTVAGNCTFGFNGDNQPATNASLGGPQGVAADSSGNFYIADVGNQRIRKVDLNGIITTIAGNGSAGFSGDGGQATAAEIWNPSQLGFDAGGNLYFVDQGNGRIRKIDTSGIITTVAGAGFGGSAIPANGVPALSARFNQPFYGVAVAPDGTIFIADTNGSHVWEVDSSGPGQGLLHSVAGNGTLGESGDGGPADLAQTFQADNVAFDSEGNYYIADWVMSVIRKVTPDGTITTVAGLLGGTQYTGYRGYNGDEIPATQALLHSPAGMAIDAAGNLYIADSFNNRIRKIDTDGIIHTVAGNGIEGYSGDSGPATQAELDTPNGVAVDQQGNIYIADTGQSSINPSTLGGNRIRKVAPDGTITTIAGNGVGGYNADGIPAVAAEVNGPYGLALDSAGNLYLADTFNSRVRKIDMSGVIPTISTVAGNGTAGFSGDGGPATAAELASPVGVSLDKKGSIAIADSYYSVQRVRMVDPSGNIATMAGNGTAGLSGDGGPAAQAMLSYPGGVAFDPGGNLFIADGTYPYGNNRIREVFLVPPAQLNSAVSRKAHGSAGTFDVDLTNGGGIECRSGGAGAGYTLVFTFANPLIKVGSAAVTSGTGSVVSSNIDPADAHNYIVSLAGVSNAQTITVSLTNLTDSAGDFSSVISAAMGVLLGDVNASRRVDAADVSSVRQQTLQPVTASNFRNDINASGRIDAADVSIARQQTLTSLP